MIVLIVMVQEKGNVVVVTEQVASMHMILFLVQACLMAGYNVALVTVQVSLTVKIVKEQEKK